MEGPGRAPQQGLTSVYLNFAPAELRGEGLRMTGRCKGTARMMLTRTETYDGAHQLPEGQRWTIRLIFMTVGLTRKETYGRFPKFHSVFLAEILAH